MRLLVAIVSGVCACWAPAGAQDQALPASNPSQVSLDWNGFYAGLRAGFASGDAGPFSDDGVAGGLTGGYDWQAGSAVAGVSGGLLLADIDLGGQASLDSIVDVRARFGYAFDRVLVYGTGGGAYASGRGVGDAGWTAGAGLDFSAAEDVFWGMRYLKYRFDNLNNTGTSIEIDLIEAEITYRF